MLGALLIALAATDFRLFRGDDKKAPAPRPTTFDVGRTLADVRLQLGSGPRPAGSTALRRLAERLRARLPDGRYEPIPSGLRNIVGALPGRRPAILVGAHYDSKDLPGFLGANDGAVGTAAVLELARVLALKRPRDPREVRFVLFDGEEQPRGTPEKMFVRFGLRGSKAYAHRHAGELSSMILLDFIGNRRLSIPREAGSDPVLWGKLRAAAVAAATLDAFPVREVSEIYDDHTPFARERVPSIDLIDFDYPCFHRRCDTLAQISPDSVGKAGATVTELVRRLEAGH
ncbi:MAG: M28 family metallopeptidase [Solirubrobacteraceae bacterium]